MLYLWGSAIMHVTYTEMKYTYSTIYSSVTIQWEHRIVERMEIHSAKFLRLEYNASSVIYFIWKGITGDNITYHILIYNDMMPGKS